MNKAELEATLRMAAERLGASPAQAKVARRGKVSVAVLWLRPERVALRADPSRGVLVLEDYLPFVLAGGRLHRRLKACVGDRAKLVSRNGHVSLAVPAGEDWAAALDSLLEVARTAAAMLHAEWPDYASGVFAPALA